MRRRFCYTGGLFPQVARAGEWFLRSGIQTPDGGVARYYRLDLGRNHAVSTEITGYAASVFVFLHSLTLQEDRSQLCRRLGELRSPWQAQVCPTESAPPEAGRVEVTGQEPEANMKTAPEDAPGAKIRAAALTDARYEAGRKGVTGQEPVVRMKTAPEDAPGAKTRAAVRTGARYEAGRGEVTGQEPVVSMKTAPEDAPDARTRAAVLTDPRYLDRARAAARFLTGAWHAGSASMPFEVDPAQFTYFFDCGMVVRGLLAVWRATGDEEFLDCARRVGHSMAHDFRAPDGQFHPILTLPAKRPLEHDPLRWSQSPGCYQLKAGMAWWDLWEATGDGCYRDFYQALLQDSLRTAPDFLPGHTGRRKVVDRLHAFLYFLEGLLPMAADAHCAAAVRDGMARVAELLRELAPEFERSDVYAQLLRVRLYADRAGAAELDGAAAQWEADRLLEFAAAAAGPSGDPRQDGGFYFGRTAGNWEPFINPVSTAFALQALALRSGVAPADRHLLI